MAEQRLRITQVRSLIGRAPDQRATVRSLGLKRIRHCVEQPDRPEIRGMVRKVSHLVEWELISVGATAPAAEQAAEDEPAIAAADEPATPDEPEPTSAAKKPAKKAAKKATKKSAAKKAAKKTAAKKAAKKAAAKKATKKAAAKKATKKA